MIGKLKLAAVSLVIATSAHAESLVCIAEKANGFKYDDGAWVHTIFRADSRYLIKINDKAASVTEFGYDWAFFPEYTCSAGRAVVRCNDYTGQFVLKLSSLRFTSTYIGGYNQDGNDDTPYIEIGTCAKM